MSLSGSRIKECRQRNKLTQEDVARHLGIGKQAVYKYEIGAVTNIPLENIEKMAALFDVSPEYLSGWSDILTPYDPVREETTHALDKFAKDNVLTKTFSLDKDETMIIHTYRSLDQPGKDYILQQVGIASAMFGGKDQADHLGDVG